MAENQLPETEPFFATEDENNIRNDFNNQAFPITLDPPPPVAQEEERPRPETEAEEQPSLTDSYFATEGTGNIANNNDHQEFHMPMDPPPPVVQEETRPHPQTDQLVSSTPHMPRWRRDNGEMVCVLLAPSPIDTAPNTPHLLPHTLMREQRRVLLENMLPLPTQATTHQGGGLDLLVCPPLPRNAGIARWLHRMEIVPGTALQSLTSYEEGSEVVCGGVGWRRSQSMPHHTSGTSQPSGVVGISFGAMDTHGHSPLCYISQLLQLLLETANTCVLVELNINCSYLCTAIEVACTHNGRDPPEDDEFECNTVAEENPTPPTQQFVSGRTVSHNVTCTELFAAFHNHQYSTN